MARERPVWQRASLRAASRASAPLLVKKTRLGGQPLREIDLRLVVKVGARHVQELAGLVADRLDNVRVTVAGGGHGDAGGEVEEQVPVHVPDDRAAAAVDDEWVGARVRRRDIAVVPLKERLSPRPRQLRPNARHRAAIKLPHQTPPGSSQ
jgi:hypothetical protein